MAATQVMPQQILELERRNCQLRTVQIAKPAAACIALLLLCSAFAWAGGIQKCLDAQGKVAYSDKPCPTTQKSETIPTAPKATETKQSAAPKAAGAESAARSDETEEQRVKLAGMSPQCRALWQEVVTLQTTIETPEEISHYIKRSELYQRTCSK